MRISARVAIIFTIALLLPRLSDAASVTFMWDPPPDWVPAGYILYAGTTPGVYVQQFNVGATTSYRLDGVPEGGTYYFAVAAYDATDAISSRSNEASVTVPATAPPPVTGLVLAPSAASPQVLGTTVNWLATASGGVAPYQYQWAVNQSGQWTVGPWSSNATTDWSPTAAGDYQVRVAVRSAGSTSSTGEMVQTVPFTVAAPSTTSCVGQPPSTSIAAGAALIYSVAVTNNSSSTCGTSAFALTAAVPTGWTAAFSPAASTSLAPGATGSVTLTLAAPSGASGTYSFTVTSTNTATGEFGSATGSAVVGATRPSTLEVSLSASLSNGRERTLTLKIKVKNGNQAAAGATVAITVRSPLGATLNLTATTGADGSATLRSPLSSADVGTWQVQATATSGTATGTSTTTFTIR